MFKLIFFRSLYVRLMKVVLGDQHAVSRQLGLYNTKISSCEAKLHQLQGEHLLLPTMLCKKVAVQMSNWFKAQASSPAPVAAPVFTQVFDDIDAELPWQPVMSPMFLATLKLDSFR